MRARSLFWLRLLQRRADVGAGTPASLSSEGGGPGGAGPPSPPCRGSSRSLQDAGLRVRPLRAPRVPLTSVSPPPQSCHVPKRCRARSPHPAGQRPRASLSRDSGGRDACARPAPATQPGRSELCCRGPCLAGRPRSPAHVLSQRRGCRCRSGAPSPVPQPPASRPHLPSRRGPRAPHAVLRGHSPAGPPRVLVPRAPGARVLVPGVPAPR